MATSEFEEQLESYIENIREARIKNQHHDHRRSLFVALITKCFNLQFSEVVLEKHINVKGSSIRGRIDALYEDIVFEFKRDLANERTKGQEELNKYLLSLQPRRNCFGILTDGLYFEAYKLSDKNLVKFDEIDFTKASNRDIFLWLDSFLFSEKDKKPVSDDIVKRFGVKSPVFISSLELLNNQYSLNKGNPTIKIKFAEWDRLLSKVYGISIADEELFLRHTYLATVSKLIAYVSLFKTRPQSQSELADIISGDSFRKQGFSNLVENDFFSWILDQSMLPSTHQLLSGLIQHLNVYDLDQIDEDLLKELYQGLVDPDTRHDLGEFYTPDWLAQLTLQEVNYGQGKKLLDPACGSGTFLFNAVKQLKISGMSGTELIEEALNHITGMDVHPVAVIISKINYILALSNDFLGYTKNILIPVYLADSLIVKTKLSMMGETVRIDVPTIDNKQPNDRKPEYFEIPIEVGKEAEELDQLIDEMQIYAQKSGASKAGFNNFLISKGVKDIGNFWSHNLDLMHALIKDGRDTIWTYILKNFSRPIFLGRQGFDIIAGNPPWLTYRDIKDAAYQKEVKDLVLDYSLLTGREVNLFPHMELSTLFYVLSSHIYLKPGGAIAFVMNRSVITGAKQHKNFQGKLKSSTFSPIRQNEKPSSFLQLQKVIDTEKVTPLFNVPSCVIISKKEYSTNPGNINRLTLEGQLDSKNASWQNAQPLLDSHVTSVPIGDVFLPQVQYSVYHSKFNQGATIVPRFMWFVEPSAKTGFGVINHSKPSLKTEASILDTAKTPWKGHDLQGSAEAKYLYASLLANNLIPFGCINFNLVVLPIEPYMGKSKIVDSKRALNLGDTGAHEWFGKSEMLWKESKKEGSSFTIYERLDFHKLLTCQQPKGLYNVVYNTSGTNLTASVIDTTGSVELIAEGLETQGFIADAKTYIFQTDNEDEANYLCAVLNSDYVNAAIKPYQTKGTWGARDIHRRPFEVVPIPKFSSQDKKHLKLASLSKQCHAKVNGNKQGFIKKSIGRMRLDCRQLLKIELEQINKLVQELFQ